MNLPKQTRCKLNLIEAVESPEQINLVPLITVLESFSKRTNRSDGTIQMADKKSEPLETPDRKKEIPVGEMDKCSASGRTNYRYHLYCLVLSFIMVHLIYRYLSFLFP